MANETQKMLTVFPDVELLLFVLMETMLMLIVSVNESKNLATPICYR